MSSSPTLSGLSQEDSTKSQAQGEELEWGDSSSFNSVTPVLVLNFPNLQSKHGTRDHTSGHTPQCRWVHWTSTLLAAQVARVLGLLQGHSTSMSL